MRGKRRSTSPPTVGGDPGYPALAGSATLPASRRPLRLARQYTYGWSQTDAASKAAFETFLRAVEAAGIAVLEPGASGDLAAYEDATARVPEFFFDAMLWEFRWPLQGLARSPARHGQRGDRGLHRQGGADDARRFPPRRRPAREELRARHRALAGTVDGFITLAHIGPGQKGQPAVGTPWYNDASSAIGAPTFNLPLLAVEDVPLGVQIMGFEGGDEDLAAMARWFLEHFKSRTVGEEQ